MILNFELGATDGSTTHVHEYCMSQPKIGDEKKKKDALKLARYVTLFIT